VGAARTKFLNVAAKVRNRHPDLPHQVIAEIDDMHREALNELAETRFPDEIRERLARYFEDLDGAA